MSLMNAHRLRAPSEDGALLADPPLSSAAALLAGGSGRLDGWDYDFQGRRAGRLRALARRQAAERSREFLARFGLDVPAPLDPAAPLIVTGHQPELFHPGVWVKNFAVGGLARAVGGTGLNLIVDNDLPKSTTIRVPRRTGAGLAIRRVEFDHWAGEVPFEDLDVRDESAFASFGDRVRETLAGEVTEPLIEAFWPRVLRRRDQTRRVGLRFAAARRELEAAWGVHNLEVPLSALCETEGFLWFASHVLAHLDRFQQVHNDALARYRAVYGIRSKHHPVADLARRDDWREAPFWAWRAGEPRRRPLLVRQLSRTMELRLGGEDRPLMEIPLAPDREACCAVEQLLALPARQVRLRTRALTTTMFARLVLGDLFVHGIGGAKYDELGDEIIRRFFGIEPPDYLTLSMTLWLGLPADPSSRDRLEAASRSLRDLTYNPDRHLPSPAPAGALPLVDAKRRAVASAAETHPGRLARFLEIRRCNEALQPWVRPAREELDRERSHLLAGVHDDALARNREYALVLHSEARLRRAMGRAVAEAAGA